MTCLLSLVFKLIIIFDSGGAMEDQSSYKENQLYCYSAKKNELGEDLDNNPN